MYNHNRVKPSQDPREDADNPGKRRDPQGSLLDPDISDEDFFAEVNENALLS